MGYLPRLLLLAAVSIPGSHGSTLTNSSGDAVPLWDLATDIRNGSAQLCNKTFADANATGVFYTNPNVAQWPQLGQPDNHSGKTLPVGWGVTMHMDGFNSNTSGVAAGYTLWFDTNGADYSNNYALGYDACAVAGLSLNYNTQLRGQSDNGSCLSTLDVPCITAIEGLVSQWATWLTTPSGSYPNSNLTRGALPGICRRLSNELVAAFPAECSPFFEDELDGIAYPLTSSGDTYQASLSSNCTMNGTFQNVLTLYNNDSQSVYEAWAQSVSPVIGVWMPIADASASQTISGVSVQIGCGHINHFNAGSYVPPALPAAGPVAYNTTGNSTANSTAQVPSHLHQDISGGAIASIVVGVVVLLAAMTGLCLWWWRSRKTQPAMYETLQLAEVSGQDTRYEMADNKHMVQLPASSFERDADARIWELESTVIPQELSAVRDR